MSLRPSGLAFSVACRGGGGFVGRLCSTCTQVFGYQSIISVNNGGLLGEWKFIEKCPKGWFARGFSLKVDSGEGLLDDTALNGIQLHCTPSPTSNMSKTIESLSGKWGSWTKSRWCHSGFLRGFVLQVQPPQGYGDDTAANNIMFTCSNYEILLGLGGNRGNWGIQSNFCGTGICGIQTRQESPQGFLNDDTALNDVRFYCCHDDDTQK
uniref:Vitelline membrane outer layer protein 1 homolog n=1 Tax=Erpetoichthys calabaricus TaxID=27687 RepID=A0A8C4SLF4_ERPCA